MSLTTYSGLKASIANWLNRTDLAAEIPDFIALAEDRLSQEVRIPTIEKTISVILDSNGVFEILITEVVNVLDKTIYASRSVGFTCTVSLFFITGQRLT